MASRGFLAFIVLIIIFHACAAKSWSKTLRRDFLRYENEAVKRGTSHYDSCQYLYIDCSDNPNLCRNDGCKPGMRLECLKTGTAGKSKCSASYHHVDGWYKRRYPEH